MSEVQLTPAETLALANKVKAEAEASTAAATAATIAANERKWQYERETFKLRNPDFIDSEANVSVMKPLLAAKGWGWEADSMEFVYRNNLDRYATAAAKPIAAPVEAAPVEETYGVTPEYVQKLSPGELRDIRKTQPKKYARIETVISDVIAKCPRLARKFFNGLKLTEEENVEFQAAIK